MTNNPLIPIILCGGSGSRLWPLSRKSFPKQYLSLSLNPEDKKSLLEKTIQRTKGIKEICDPILICNEDHRFIIAAIKNINISKSSIILEPFGRNTAPAIAIAAQGIRKEKSNLLIMSLIMK